MKISTNEKKLSLSEQQYTKKLFLLLSDIHKQINNIHTINDLITLIRTREQEYRGSITYIGATAIVAQEIDIRIWVKLVGYQQQKNELLKMEHAEMKTIKEIKNLPISTKISTKGFIQSISYPKEFFKNINNSKQKNKRSQIIIRYQNEEIPLILWGKPCEQINKYAEALRLGKEIIVTNVIIRENNRRKNHPKEIHYSKGTEISINDEKIDKTQRPIRLFTNFSQIKEENETIDAKGRVINIFPIKEFLRADGSTGKVQIISVIDNENNSLQVAIWDQSIKLDCPLGSQLYLSNFKTQYYRNQFQLNSQSLSFIECLPPEEESIKHIKQTTIAKILTMEKGKIVSFDAIVDEIGNTRLFNHSDGSEGQVTKIKLIDETKIIFLILWDKKIEDFLFQKGDRISIYNGKTVRRDTGSIEVHSTPSMKFSVAKQRNIIKHKKKEQIIKVSDRQPIISTKSSATITNDKYMNILHGLVKVLFNSYFITYITSDIHENVQENIFFEWVNEYMEKQGLKQIPVTDLIAVIDQWEQEEKIERKDGYLEWISD